jgi:hypothetical protein
LPKLDAHAAHRSEAIRTHHRGVPCSGGAEVVANNGRSRNTRRIEYRHEVTNAVPDSMPICHAALISFESVSTDKVINHR